MSPDYEMLSMIGATKFFTYASILLLIQAWMMSNFGQSIGKKILGIRVVKTSGAKVEGNQVVGMRYCTTMAILLVLLLLISPYVLGIEINHRFEYALAVWYACLCLSMWRWGGEKRQTWQDKLAATMVVKVLKIKG